MHEQSKRCNKCQQVKSRTEFGKEKYGDGRRPECKVCKSVSVNRQKSNEASRRYRENNPERYQQSQRNSWLRRNYGITSVEYDQMAEDQGYTCAICSATEPGGGRGFWCVDHDHDTGLVRGLLCANCNSGLGNFKDNVMNLANAIAYLAAYDGDEVEV